MSNIQEYMETMYNRNQQSVEEAWAQQHISMLVFMQDPDNPNQEIQDEINELCLEYGFDIEYFK
jgi:hypothetical protein